MYIGIPIIHIQQYRNQLSAKIRQIPSQKMKRKQANMYSVPSMFSNPPYLSPQQLAEFQSQFTLFDSQLDLRKLKQSFSIINTTAFTTSQNYKPVQLFINLLCNRKDKCNFKQYIACMTEHLVKQEQTDFIMEMIGENKKQISPKIVQQILEQTMGRQILKKQLNNIMSKLFQIENQSQPITKKQIINLYLNNKNKN